MDWPDFIQMLEDVSGIIWFKKYKLRGREQVCVGRDLWAEAGSQSLGLLLLR